MPAGADRFASRPLLAPPELEALVREARRADGGPALERLLADHLVLRRLADGCQGGIALLDTELRYLYVNEALARMHGLPRSAHTGRRLEALLPGLDVPARVLKDVLRTGRPRTVTVTGRTRADVSPEPRWWLCSYHRLDDASGDPLGVAAVVFEVTEDHHRSEALRHARTRSAMLDEATARIGASLNVEAACQALAEVLVPQLADYAAVDVPDAARPGRPAALTGLWRMRRIALAADPRLAGAAEELGARGSVIRHQSTSGISRVLADGRPLVLNYLTEDQARTLAPSPERIAQYRRAGLHSAACLPLTVRHGRQVVGTVTACRMHDSPAFTKEDVRLLEELTDRAATSIDHAQRFTQEHETALEIQRALLAEPTPPGPGVEIARRYLPAGEGAEVGGDWFVAVPLPRGRTLLTVGDVMGHGVPAAAAMSTYRTILGTLALQDDAPDRLLTRAETVAAALRTDRAATCLVAVLDPDRERVTLARAGHPPPLLVTPDGATRLLDLPSAPPLGTGLGSFGSATVDMPSGSTLLLYTDGLIERRDRDIDDGLAALAALPLRPAAPLEEILNTVIGRLDAESSEDDVAVLAARIRPGD